MTPPARPADIRGVNYVPSNAVNATEMWLEFDAATIDRELGFAEGLALNSNRVEHRIGWYLWELMIGVDQTRYQWPGSPHAAETIVFQGLLYPDGTPYSGEEVELIGLRCRVRRGRPTTARRVHPR